MDFIDEPCFKAENTRNLLFADGIVLKNKEKCKEKYIITVVKATSIDKEIKLTFIILLKCFLKILVKIYIELFASITLFVFSNC